MYNRQTFNKNFLYSSICLFFIIYLISLTSANPDAKRLYDDLLSTYNRLIRPVSNNTDTVLVKLGLRLSQLIELVSNFSFYFFFYRCCCCNLSGAYLIDEKNVNNHSNLIFILTQGFLRIYIYFMENNLCLCENFVFLFFFCCEMF
jgi:hypothetical protein